MEDPVFSCPNLIDNSANTAENNSQTTIAEFLDKLKKKFVVVESTESHAPCDKKYLKARRGRKPKACTLNNSSLNITTLHQFFGKKRQRDSTDEAGLCGLDGDSTRQFLKKRKMGSVNEDGSHTNVTLSSDEFNFHLVTTDPPTSTQLPKENDNVSLAEALVAIQKQLANSDAKNEKLIGDLRGFLESGLDKLNESMSDVQKRLTVCEAQGVQLKGDIESLRGNLSTEVGNVLQLQKDTIVKPFIDDALQQFSSRLNMLQATCNRLDKSARKFNIVLKGLPDGNSLDSVNKFLSAEFGIANAAIDTFVLNEESMKCRVKLRDLAVKSTIMKSKRQILGSRPIYIDNDLTPREADMAKKLRDTKKSALKDGHSVVMRGNAISIDNVWYTWDTSSDSLAVRENPRSNRPRSKNSRGGGLNSNVANNFAPGGLAHGGAPNTSRHNGNPVLVTSPSPNLGHGSSLNMPNGPSWATTVLNCSTSGVSLNTVQSYALPPSAHSANNSAQMSVIQGQRLAVPTTFTCPTGGPALPPMASNWGNNVNHQPSHTQQSFLGRANS